MAYRSRPRPSSAPGAKASTVCPYYLDGDPDNTQRHCRCDTRSRNERWISSRDKNRCVVFKGRRGTSTHKGARSLKTQQHTTNTHTETMQACATRSGQHSGNRHRQKTMPALISQSIPRKEVIQPHLPVRLPCYDFTPVTSPTFDGSLPCGLGHRLRVLLTPVV